MCHELPHQLTRAMAEFWDLESLRRSNEAVYPSGPASEAEDKYMAVVIVSDARYMHSDDLIVRGPPH
jgi:hypothetical protein